MKNVATNIDVDREFVGQIVNSCYSKLMVSVAIDDEPILFRVNTGADVNVIPMSYANLFKATCKNGIQSCSGLEVIYCLLESFRRN